jgi:hypothetical protein
MPAGTLHARWYPLIGVGQHPHLTQRPIVTRLGLASTARALTLGMLAASVVL